MAALSRYELGKTGLIACVMDQRFSYALYVPSSYDPTATATQSFDVVVPVHGSNRPVMYYRDAFSEFAEERQCFVVSPLFPIGIINKGDVDNYKYIDYLGLRYDLILLGMLAEVESRYRLSFARKVFHGFSGGGQFVHRFYYLHPEEVHAVSIGAPGKVTLLSDDRPWWVGTSDTERRFGKRINVKALRRSRVMLIVGDRDLEEDEIHVSETSELWMPGANGAGRTRVERIHTLAGNLRDHGIENKVTLVEGVEHSDGGPMMGKVIEFFREALDP